MTPTASTPRFTFLTVILSLGSIHSLIASPHFREPNQIQAEVVSMREWAARFYELVDTTGQKWVANTLHPGPCEYEALLGRALKEDRWLALTLRSEFSFAKAPHEEL